ncbi:MAG: UDP-galactopyranose mutase [Clostridiales bacterium]|nr:UDP-galactopyranose mutase [Clostridiales bacterium]
MRYDFLIVGAGLFGAAFARRALDAGKTCLALEKRSHIGGNCYTECVDGVQVHKYGAHIFHTNDKAVWGFVTKFAEFNRYTHSPLANFKGQLFSLPFNMYTFYQMWGVTSPGAALAKIDSQRCTAGEPQNLEEQAISLVGTDIYEKLIKGYTEKQWGRPCRELPAFIVNRLPLRFTFDCNYFNAAFQGVPKAGYTDLVRQMLAGADICLNTDFLADKEFWRGQADWIVYTGPVDAYFGYQLGALEYRSLRFETETMDTANYQGVAVMNFTDAETPFTRIIEHKFFDSEANSGKTVITREYPSERGPGAEPYYPVNNDKNNALYSRYAKLAKAEPSVFIKGRLGEYQYYDMDKVIGSALELADSLL